MSPARAATFAVAIGALLAATACNGNKRRPVRPEPPKEAVSLVLPGLEGSTVSVADARGYPLVIFMFTTWSLRAQVEAPQFVQMHDKHAKRGLRIIGIALDRRTGPLVKTYVNYMHMRFPVAVSEPDALQLRGALGRTLKVPRTLLLDRQGRIRLDFQGATRFDKLGAAIEALLSSN